MHVTTHYKGFDHFVSGGYDTGVAYFKRAMEGWGDWVHMPGHEAQAGFPLEADGLSDYSVIIISDIGADTFLLHPRTWLNGERTPNRLRLIEEYVRGGGGLIMAGGYLSYQGINGVARYHGTPIEEALPVEIEPYDDRVECPEGVQPKTSKTKHEITSGPPAERGLTSSATIESGRRRERMYSPPSELTRCSSSASTAKVGRSLGQAT